MPFILQTTLVAIVVAAGIFDWRFRRIPNWLNLSGLVLGLGLNTLLYGVEGCGSAFLGLGAALIVYIPLYALRGMGAGDVKLMAAVGAIAGPSDWLSILLITSAAGGFISLAVIIYKRRLIHTFLNLLLLISELVSFRAPAQSGPELDVSSCTSLRLPHAVPIAIGCLAFVAVRGLQVS